MPEPISPEEPRRAIAVSDTGSVTRCAHDLQSPDPRRREEAARQIWLRFADRLQALVGRRLDPRLRRRVGADDLAQSLFGSFFAASPGPNGPPRCREDLWRLLVHFALCKIAGARDRHFARRRDVRRECSMDAAAGDPSTIWGLEAAGDLSVLTPADELGDVGRQRGP